MEIVRVTEKRRRLVSIDNGDGHFHLDGAIAGERINDDANPLQLLILGRLTCAVSCLFAVIGDNQANLGSIRSTLV